jgi:hypothetical protein
MLNITQEQAKWILASYAPIRGYGRVDKYKFEVLEALSIMRGTPVTISCNCELGAIARIANNMFEQYEADIKAIANPVVEQKVVKKTRGRQKTGL